MKVDPSVIETIQRHAARTYPEECCGVLVGTIGSSPAVVEALAVANTHQDNRSRRYTIDADSLLRISREADRRGLDVVGFYHSHPDHPARPSETDLREATFPHYIYMIQSVERGAPGSLTAWSLAEDRSSFVPRKIEVTDQTNRVLGQ